MFLAASVCRKNVAFSVKFNIWSMQQHSDNLLMLHTCRINLCKRGRGSDFFSKKYFVRKHIFLQYIIKEMLQYAYCSPKFWIETILVYLSTNNRYNIFIRFITVNSTVHHLCKNLYIKYTMQNKLSNLYFEQ